MQTREKYIQPRKQTKSRQKHVLRILKLAITQAEVLPVYRDNNKDSVIDTDGSIDIGFHGINIHRASSNWQSKQVNKWSAGCQVFANPNNFDYFIELCKKSTRLYGSRITYTLIEEKDLM